MKKMGLKQFLIMVTAMIIFVVLYFSLSGPVAVYPALGDVFSFSRGELVAESELWSFCVPDHGSGESYFCLFFLKKVFGRTFSCGCFKKTI